MRKLVLEKIDFPFLDRIFHSLHIRSKKAEYDLKIYKYHLQKSLVNKYHLQLKDEIDIIN